MFNGPFKLQKPSPAFTESGFELQNQGLFYGPPRPKPYRLVLGPFVLTVMVTAGTTANEDSGPYRKCRYYMELFR